MSDTIYKPWKTLRARCIKAFRLIKTIRFNSFDTEALLEICTKLQRELETMKQ